MNEKDYWNSRYAAGGNSGYGSYGEQLEKKLKWLSGLPIHSITEIGCGDFNFGKHLLELYPQATYFGYDISEEIIKRNREMWPQHHFGDVHEEIGLLRSDLLLCIDVLFHVIDDSEYNRLIRNLWEGFDKYLAITAYEYDQTEGLSPHVKIRKFDYKMFGEPIIRECVEEDGELFFYLFRR